MASLLLVPARAGGRFFKFCSGTAVFMMTAAVWLVWRRLDAPTLAAWATVLGLAVVYNRAHHFGWRRAQAPLLVAALGVGVVAIWLGAQPGPRWLLLATDLTSAVLLGAAASAMILGHWYLVVLDLPIEALRRLTVLLVVALVLRTLVVALALAGPAHAGYEGLAAVAHGLWSPDGVFIWMRLLFGLMGPLSLLWFIWKTVEIRSTQSATGILYVQLFLVLAGELLAKYLRVAAGVPV
ncbi:MAG TPA: hypothetical protein VF310_03915 [Vicinamibacteria bacterium]